MERRSLMQLGAGVCLSSLVGCHRLNNESASSIESVIKDKKYTSVPPHLKSYADVYKTNPRQASRDW